MAHLTFITFRVIIIALKTERSLMQSEAHFLKDNTVYQAIQEARYALVDGNSEPVPVDTIKAWLDVIETSLLKGVYNVHSF